MAATGARIAGADESKSSPRAGDGADGWSVVNRRARSKAGVGSGHDDAAASLASDSTGRAHSPVSSSSTSDGRAFSPRGTQQALRKRTSDAPRWTWNPNDPLEDKIRDLEEWALTADEKERIDLWKDWTRRLRREAASSPKDGSKTSQHPHPQRQPPQTPPSQPSLSQASPSQLATPGPAAAEGEEAGGSAAKPAASPRVPRETFSAVFFQSDALQNVFENAMRDWPPDGSPGLEDLVNLVGVCMDGGAEAHRRMLAHMKQLRDKLTPPGTERPAFAPQVLAAVCAAAAGLKHDLGAERQYAARAEEAQVAMREREAALAAIPSLPAPPNASPSASPVLRGMLPPLLDGAPAGPAAQQQPPPPDRGAALAAILKLCVQRREALQAGINKAPFRARQSDLRAFFDHLLQSLEKASVRITPPRRVDPEAEKRRELAAVRADEARVAAEEETLLQRKAELEAQLKEVEGRLAQIPAAREKLQERLVSVAVRHSRLELQASVERPARERDFRPVERPALLASQYCLGELHGCIRDVVQARAGPRFDAARTAGIHFCKYALDHLRARRALLDGLQKRMQFVRGKIGKLEEEQRQSRDLGMDELAGDPRQLQKLQAALEDGGRLFLELGREVAMVVAHGRQLLTDGTLAPDLRDFREQFEPLSAAAEAHVRALVELTGVDPAAPASARPAAASPAAPSPPSPGSTSPATSSRSLAASRSPTPAAGAGAGGGAGAGPSSSGAAGEGGRRKKEAGKPEASSPVKKPAPGGGAGAAAAAAAAGRSPFLFLSHHARQKSSPDALLFSSGALDRGGEP